MSAALWTRDDAARATGGESPRDWTATGVSIDTRSLAPGDLFVALTDTRDGHDFVAEALEKGAATALVSRRPQGLAADAPLLVVTDVPEALRALGRAARARFSGRVVAVTGSVGKTGTKEMLRLALGASGARVHAAEKSFNNHWGVPLTLVRMDPAADFAVIEIGMSAPGEIGPLARLAQPHVAMVTTVAAVHLAAFRDLRGIAAEKAAVFSGLVPGGVAVVNRDIDTYGVLLRAARKAGARLVRFGTAGRPEFRLTEVQIARGVTAVSARARGEAFLFKLNAPGRHLAANALGVMAVVDALGLDLARAGFALGAWVPPEGRGARWTVTLGPGGLDGAITLIDESYNANPSALAAALEVFAQEAPQDSPGHGRRIAFLGDMLELGDQEIDLHASVAALPALRAVTTVHCAGIRMRALHEVLPARQRGEWFESSEAMVGRVRKLVDAGDVVMVKGSLGSRMARVVEAIKTLGVPRPKDSLEG